MRFVQVLGYYEMDVFYVYLQEETNAILSGKKIEKFYRMKMDKEKHVMDLCYYKDR